MINLSKTLSRELFPISLILFLAFARLIPHPPNFTPIIAVAITSVYLFRNIYLSFIVIIGSMFLSDLFIGFHKNIFFVYFSLLFITFIFSQIRIIINFKNLFVFSFLASFIFYLISNFGVWILSDMYSKNIDGLIYCYFLAIPFFTNTFLSTIFFSYTALFVNYFFRKFQKT